MRHPDTGIQSMSCVLHFALCIVLVLLFACGGCKTEFLPPSLVAPSDAETVTAASVSFEWNSVAGASKYRIQVSTYNDFTFTAIDETVTTTSYHSLSTPAGACWWRVRGIDSHDNEGDWSEVWSFTFANASTPANVSAAPGDGKVTTSWYSVAGVTSYNIYRSTGSGVSKTDHERVVEGITTTSYTHTDLANGATYYFVVTAVNTYGESDESGEVSATPSVITRDMDRIHLEPISEDHGEFGWSVTSGDFNGDGLRDVVVSDPVADGLSPNTGEVYVYYGNPEFPVMPDETLTDPDEGEGDEFGFYVASAGDTDGDGYDDLVVATGWGVDKVFLFPGSPTGLQNETEKGISVQGLKNRFGKALTLPELQKQTMPRALKNQPNDALMPPDGYSGYGFGHGISKGGDINGDGYSDILIAVNGSYVCVYYGSESGISGEPDSVVSLVNNNPDAVFVEVSIIGDINGDGFDDAAVNNRNKGPISHTDIYVYYGSSAGISAYSDSLTVDAGRELEYGFSIVLSPAGDHNHDGISDLLVGNQWESESFDYAGEAYIFSGSYSGVSDSPVTLVNPGPSYNVRFGNDVDGIGDFNYDGIDDVVVGCPYDGFAAIYYGTSGGATGSPDLFLEEDGEFGWAVSQGGDITGNGENFVIIGDEFGGAYLYAFSNSRPVAATGDDQTLLSTDIAQLDGRGSSDEDGDMLTFAWSILSKPDGSNAAFSDVTTPTPAIRLDLPGSYALQLIVNDGLVDSEPDSVLVAR
ncbi:MAG: hypothetical protein BA868_09640 [Desulfobacterales bacterium C00003106]|nr:MAG: hypothetical protein BA868_09640 [Desulfobacterales bacterium C00003106]